MYTQLYLSQLKKVKLLDLCNILGIIKYKSKNKSELIVLILAQPITLITPIISILQNENIQQSIKYEIVNSACDTHNKIELKIKRNN